MNRRTAREIALQLGFSVVMTESFAEDVLNDFFDGEHYASLSSESALFSETPDEKQMAYITRLVKLIFDHRVQLDAYIEKYAKGWKVGRISKTASAILRCAMCEVLYMDDIPNAAAINEAVELAKRYEDEDVVAFINGILGGFMRGEVDKTEPETGTPEPETDASESETDTPESESGTPEPETDALEPETDTQKTQAELSDMPEEKNEPGFEDAPQARQEE